MSGKILTVLTVVVAIAAGRQLGKHRVSPFVDATLRDAVRVDFLCPRAGSFRFPDETKCESFITCNDDLEAYEVACPPGMHYVVASGPEEALCDVPEEAKCNQGVTPVTTTTTTPRPVGPTPQPGDPCNPDLCEEVGYCKDYLVCDKDTSTYVQLSCGKNLWWNSASPNGPDSSTVHGGTCDFFMNLPKSLQDIYIADDKCVCPCDWFQEANQYCTGFYTYRKPFDYFTSNEKDREVELRCPSGLVWLGKPKLTCGRCSDAINLDGAPCCVEKEDGGVNGTMVGF